MSSRFVGSIIPVGFSLLACASAPPPAGQRANSPSRPAVASPPATTTRSEETNLPAAKNAWPLIDEPVPKLIVKGSDVLLDGIRVAETKEVVQAWSVRRIDNLWEALKQARERWKHAHPGAEFPGVIQFQFEPCAPAVVVKSIVGRIP